MPSMDSPNTTAPINMDNLRPIRSSKIPAGTSAINTPTSCMATARPIRLKETLKDFAYSGSIGKTAPCPKESSKVGRKIGRHNDVHVNGVFCRFCIISVYCVNRTSRPKYSQVLLHCREDMPRYVLGAQSRCDYEHHQDGLIPPQNLTVR